MAKVAVLGLGKMGVGMARSLRRAGHDVTAWNRTADKMHALAADGIVAAASPADAARDADACIAMVSDDEASDRVWSAPDGVLSSAKSGAFVIECSTLSHGHVVTLARRAADCGMRYVDCPVNGAPTAAAQGQLTLLVGAMQADLEAVRPILTAVATSILHFGPIGTGTAFKLINNLYGAVQIAGLAEAITLANRLGLDKTTLTVAIENGPCASPHVKRLVAGMVQSRIAEMPGLSIGLREKDARYAMAMAHEAKLEQSISEVAHKWYALAKPELGSQDDSALVAAVDMRDGSVNAAFPHELT
jgi:3-hydroxyisobutyrate dehydrogenase